ncbi:YkvI family membrane protein [Lacicoccus alkaliphilus]|uniref:Uncharacterized membrane protein YkvI n=1 Tax=Lacicoccus alkaliphilus DSM 16010 TaxID=1123231 RepID=A0A1M7JJC4_9BACL|nr:hypothetical protein [Salinicoccus alkaliphilus]SHM53180.1 Uncharacterized membrane protein YkvI [Salinicoccus alkaliphilus DSM 16010]
MKNTLRVAGVYIGAIIGAGYASGQEVLQFFTSSGWIGTIGAVITMILYPLLGYYLIVLGDKWKATSHKKALYKITGKYISPVIDILIVFFLFGVAVVMVAGAGSLVSQQFGIPAIIGNVTLTLLVMLVMTLGLNRIVTVISWITPFAFLLIIIIAIYSFATSSTEMATLESVATQQLSASPHWFLSALLHVSFNIVIAFGIIMMIGASEKDKVAAKRGAVLGGFTLGLIALIINLAVYANIDILQYAEMPMLLLATEFSPVIGVLMSVALFGMILSTAVPCLYTVGARFIPADTRNFKIGAVVLSLAAFSLSFVGFTQLVNFVYPLQGYVGFVLLAGLLVNVFRTKIQARALAEQR